MATHSSGLAWRIPGMVEPGGLLSLGSHRIGQDYSDLAAAAAAAAATATAASRKTIKDLFSILERIASPYSMRNTGCLGLVR